MGKRQMRLRFDQEEPEGKTKPSGFSAVKNTAKTEAENRKQKKPPSGSKKRLCTEEDLKAAKANRLRHGKKKFEDETVTKPDQKKMTVKKHAAASAASAAAGSGAHREIEKYEDDNVGVQATHQTEKNGEIAVRLADSAYYRHRLKYEKGTDTSKAPYTGNTCGKYSRNQKSAKYSSNQQSRKYSQNQQSENCSQNQNGRKPDSGGSSDSITNPISRWIQKRELKKSYADRLTGKSASTEIGNSGAAYAGAAHAGTGTAVPAAAQNIWDKVREGARNASGTAAALAQWIWESHGNGLKGLAALFFILVVFITQMCSCSNMATGVLAGISAASWPSDDDQITAAEAFYVKLEAQQQKRIADYESDHDGYDEYNYRIDDTGHDPTMLISYLSAKYGAFRLTDVEQEIEELFDLQYDLEMSAETEKRTVTVTVQAGEKIGNVVTSGYCNCSLCCGIWAGGPTASGVYPTANHTIAVDADNPTVPIGTELIMNGTLYKVEDTGAFDQYGVDFDVYYDDHSAAQAHGHQTWEAYYAGGEGETVEVSTTTSAKICTIILINNDFEGILLDRMTDEQKEIYETYMETRGNRVFFGKPVDCNWPHNMIGNYGYRFDYVQDKVVESTELELSIPEETEVLSVMNGIVQEISGDRIVLKNGSSFEISLSGCSNIFVSGGETVEMGQVIGTISEDCTLTLELTYKGINLNPYFYLDVGTEELASAGNAAAKAAALIEEAKKYLGTPYVWGGYSPSGFDCSGYVSYCLTHSGVMNTGHLSCDGLIAKCIRISKAQLQPGDLVFFQGTYETAPPSHVGIYIGSGVYGTNTFIHCGDPCQYGDLGSDYWVEHWYIGGRLNY